MLCAMCYFNTAAEPNTWTLTIPLHPGAHQLLPMIVESYGLSQIASSPLVSQTTKFPPGYLARCQEAYVLLPLPPHRELWISLRQPYCPKSDTQQDSSYRRLDCVLPRDQTQVNSRGAACAYHLSYTRSLMYTLLRCTT
eukprot:8895919-Ditylum_brightwellii.AAC.1